MKSIPGLQDIQGLDPISLWPLAIGWWIIIGLGVLSFALTLFFYFRRQQKLHSWQHHVLEKLDTLEKTLTLDNSRTSAQEVSELLRRLAIQRFSRQECAGLDGEKWLSWLAKNDASRFDWITQARCLIQAPYAPDGTVIDTKQLRQSIQAVKGWVK